MLFQFILFQVVVFGVVIYFLKRIFSGDTETAIKRLGHVYQDLLKKQAELQQKNEAAEKDLQAKREEGAAQAEKFKLEAMAEVRKKEDEILKKARAEAEEIIAKAQSSREEMTREIEAQLSKKMVEFAADILRTAFTEKMLIIIHEELVKDFVARAKDIDLSGAGMNADELIVRTPFPMKKEEIEKMNALLVTKLNRSVKFTEVADKELIAGLVLQFGTLLLDGCLASNIKETMDKVKGKY